MGSKGKLLWRAKIIAQDQLVIVTRKKVLAPEAHKSIFPKQECADTEFFQRRFFVAYPKEVRYNVILTTATEDELILTRIGKLRELYIHQGRLTVPRGRSQHYLCPVNFFSGLFIYQSEGK